MKKHMEAIVSIAAVVIALAALVVSVWDRVETRYHDRLSVTPNLTYSEDFSLGRPKEVGIALSNAGIGPAVVTSFAIYVDDNLVTDTTSGGWTSAIPTLGLGDTWVIYHWWEPDDIIPVGDKVWLLAIEPADQNAERIDSLQKAVSRLRIRVEYRSIYGDQGRPLEVRHRK